MDVLLVILVIFVVILLVVAPIVYLYLQRTYQEQKNYDRGLKMVPLLIDLPPMSDDIEIGSRDTRDVTEENISKAQVLYNILASTFKKDFKQKFYNQRHISLEIVGVHGFVYYYTVVPVELVETVKQAVISAYPSSQLHEVEEHNIFSRVGKINATTGGELSLKESYVHQIATYKDVKRDAMQSILNSLSSLNKEDGACIQILLRPADPEWVKTSKNKAKLIRDGGKKGGLLKEFVTAFVKSPTEAEDKNKSKPLSGLDQASVEAIEDKARYSGFEAKIRVIASSNVEARSQTILANMIAAFQLFDAPGRNGFKYTPTEDVYKLIEDYLLRMFPPKDRSDILNSIEMATIFHFPDQQNIPTTQLTRQESKQVDGPRNIPDNGLMLGYNIFRGVKKPIRLAIHDRQRHIYSVGQTGTGKSTFLKNLAFQDMLNGDGFAFVDPHGDVADELLAMIPRERTEDVIYFSPADTDYPLGLNLFEHDTPDQKDFLIQEVLNMLYKLYDPQHQGMMGARFEHIFRNCALTVMADPNGGTFVDVPKLFRDPQFLKQKLQHVKDQNVLDYWLKEYPASQRSNDAGEVIAWFVSKFGAFLSNTTMRNIIGQTKSSLNLRDIMDNKKILIVNLSKGRIGDLNSKLLGMVFVMKFQAAAMSRSDIPEDDRVDFCLYVDEFQNFSTDSFATMMSEARKFHLNLVVANQFTTQLTEEIRDAVFGNVGTVVSFRVGQNDVDSLVRYFQPTFDASDLLRIPNHNTVVRTLVGGVPSQPFSMATLPSIGSPNKQLFGALKQLSAAKYGRPRAVVEKEISERMSSGSNALGGTYQTRGQNNFQTGQASQGYGGLASAGNNRPQQSTPGGGAAKASSSFLDDWLSKRGGGSGAPRPTPPQYTQQQPTAPQPVPQQSAPPTPPQSAQPPANYQSPPVTGFSSNGATSNNQTSNSQAFTELTTAPPQAATNNSVPTATPQPIPNTVSQQPLPEAEQRHPGEVHLRKEKTKVSDEPIELPLR